jgi:peptide/nickel transport system permease protein
MAGAMRRFLDSDLWWSFTRSPVTVASAIVAAVCVLGAAFAPWIAPHNPFDLASLNLSDAFKPPAWAEEGAREFLLGTDDQGRDVLSAIMYGARVSPSRPSSASCSGCSRAMSGGRSTAS